MGKMKNKIKLIFVIFVLLLSLIFINKEVNALCKGTVTTDCSIYGVQDICSEFTECKWDTEVNECVTKGCSEWDNDQTTCNQVSGCFNAVTITYYYDNECGNADTANTWGKLCKVEDSSGSTAYEYDNRGRIIKETKIINLDTPKTFIIKYSYDNVDNLITVRNPDGNLITYNYNLLSQVEAIKVGDNEIASYSYKPSSVIENINYKNPVTGSEVFKTEFTYLPRDWVESITSSIIGENFFEEVYEYDGEGNLKKILTVPSNPNDYYITFNYDELDRLTGFNDVNYYHDLDTTYEYDKVGNRKSKNNVDYSYYNSDGVTTTTAELADTNRLADDGTYTYNYDDNGNVATRRDKATNEITKYNYDYENRLIKVELPNGGLVEYTYDANGNRVVRKFGEKTNVYIYDQGGNLIYEEEAIECPERFNWNADLGVCMPNFAVCYSEDLAGNYLEGLCESKWEQPPDPYSSGTSAYWDDAFNTNTDDCFVNVGGQEVQSCCYITEYDGKIYGTDTNVQILDKDGNCVSGCI